jgi:hypothetical protein
MRLSGVVLSPQLTLIEETAPSGSVAVKVTVTRTPVLTGFGETVETLTTGNRSLIVSDVVADPVEPLLSVAVTVMVKAWVFALPVLA